MGDIRDSKTSEISARRRRSRAGHKIDAMRAGDAPAEILRTKQFPSLIAEVSDRRVALDLCSLLSLMSYSGGLVNSGIWLSTIADAGTRFDQSWLAACLECSCSEEWVSSREAQCHLYNIISHEYLTAT
jgi:hypothetical protein